MDVAHKPTRTHGRTQRERQGASATVMLVTKMKTPESWRGYETASEHGSASGRLTAAKIKKKNRRYRLSGIKHGRTDSQPASQPAVGLKYSHSSSAGAARAWVAPADPGFSVWAEPGPVRSGSTSSPRASRPLRAPSPPWSFSFCRLSSSCRCLLYPHKAPLRPRPFAMSPRLAHTLGDLHLQPDRAQR